MAAGNGKGKIFLDAHLVESEIKLPFIDRIRLLCGSKVFVFTTIESTRRQSIRTKTMFQIEKVFSRRKPVETHYGPTQLSEST
jgi:hypothetical protein